MNIIEYGFLGNLKKFKKSREECSANVRRMFKEFFLESRDLTFFFLKTYYFIFHNLMSSIDTPTIKSITIEYFDGRVSTIVRQSEVVERTFTREPVSDAARSFRRAFQEPSPYLVRRVNGNVRSSARSSGDGQAQQPRRRVSSTFVGPTLSENSGSFFTSSSYPQQVSNSQRIRFVGPNIPTHQ